MIGVYLSFLILATEVTYLLRPICALLPVLVAVDIVISTRYERRFFDRISSEREQGHERCFECHYRTDMQAVDTPVCAECGFSRAESARLWQQWRPDGFKWWNREPRNKPRDDQTNKLPLV